MQMRKGITSLLLFNGSSASSRTLTSSSRNMSATAARVGGSASLPSSSSSLSSSSSSLRAAVAGNSNSNRFFTTDNETTTAKKDTIVVGVTGASGMIGGLLTESLKQSNGKYEAISLTRSSSPKEGESVMFDRDEVMKCDVIVNLAGENIGTSQYKFNFADVRPWEEGGKKDAVIKSRVDGTLCLANIMKEGNAAAADSSRSTKTLICASGVGVYGNKGIENGSTASSSVVTHDESSIIDENDPTFLCKVSREWEAAASSAAPENRVASLRFGVILDSKGGALAKLLPPFKFCLGGVVGSGNQYFSYVSSRDAVRAIMHVIEHSEIQGPVNVVAPTPTTNAGLTEALGKAVNRPAFIPLPAFVVKLLFGEMGEETLLGGQKVAPAVLKKTGFKFLDNNIDEALKSSI